MPNASRDWLAPSKLRWRECFDRAKQASHPGQSMSARAVRDMAAVRCRMRIHRRAIDDVAPTLPAFLFEQQRPPRRRPFWQARSRARPDVRCAAIEVKYLARDEYDAVGCLRWAENRCISANSVSAGSREPDMSWVKYLVDVKDCALAPETGTSAPGASEMPAV